MPHCPYAPSPLFPWVMEHIGDRTAKCQVVKKMSIVEKSNTWTMESSQKINWHNEVYTYWHQFWYHIGWLPKILKVCIESIFEQFWWPSYLMSNLTSISVNLIMSIYYFLWTFSIVQTFDFFDICQLDIFLTIWHLFDILTSFLT